MGDSAKVLEKKSLFFSRFKGSRRGGPWVGKKEVFLQAEMGLAKTLGYRSLRSQKTSSFGQTHFCLQKNLFFSSPGALRRLNFFFSIFRIFASGCVKFGQVWTSLDKFGQVWTSLDEFRQVWTSLDKFGQVWTSLNRFEQEVS